MAGIWQHRIVFSIQMKDDILEWFGLPCVDGIYKDVKGNLMVYLKNVVLGGLQRDGLSLVPFDNGWLCRDEEDRWWVLGQAEYDALDDKRHVTLFPNEQTYRQIITIKAIEKLKREFEDMSPEEQETLYNQYPDLFVITKDTED